MRQPARMTLNCTREEKSHIVYAALIMHGLRTGCEHAPHFIAVKELEEENM